MFTHGNAHEDNGRERKLQARQLVVDARREERPRNVLAPKLGEETRVLAGVGNDDEAEGGVEEDDAGDGGHPYRPAGCKINRSRQAEEEEKDVCPLHVTPVQ